MPHHGGGDPSNWFLVDAGRSQPLKVSEVIFRIRSCGPLKPPPTVTFDFCRSQVVGYFPDPTAALIFCLKLSGVGNRHSFPGGNFSPGQITPRRPPGHKVVTMPKTMNKNGAGTRFDHYHKALEAKADELR